MRFFKYVEFDENVDEPSKGRPGFEILRLCVSFLQVKLLDALLEFLMKSDEKRYLFNQITQFSCCLLITYLYIFGKVLKRDHHLVQMVIF